MANSIPVGRMRVNPHTYMQEVWDGKQWNEIEDPSLFTALPIHKSGPITSPPTINAIAPITGTGSFTAVSNAATQIKNDVVTMLEHNLRVAEVYDTVTLKLKRAELQYRDGPGSEWTPIQRTKLYE